MADSNSFSKPIDYYVRVWFGQEVGETVNGEFKSSYTKFEAKICEKDDFANSEEDENFMKLVGKAYCKPESFDYKISGQWASTSYKSPLVEIVPCSLIDKNGETC